MLICLYILITVGLTIELRVKPPLMRIYKQIRKLCL